MMTQRNFRPGVLFAVLLVLSQFIRVTAAVAADDAPASSKYVLPNPAEAKAAADAAADAWSKLPAILERIVPPTFPAREFDITKYGAIGDGTKDCTKAFADAIAACNEAGGGKVVVPPGDYLTGPIHLKSHVNLHLLKDATIKFSQDTSKYMPPVFTRYECTELMNYSPFIYAFEQHDVAITGEGTLDGQAGMTAWQPWKSERADIQRLVQMGEQGVPVSERVFGEGHHLRPNFVQPVRCKNVLIEGIRLTNSPMWVLHPLYCTNVTVSHVTVQAQGANTDGCDPDSSSDVLIKDCDFSDGDDCIAIKSGRDADGRRVNIPSENIVIQNCIFRDGHGGVTVGSETSGGIRNVYAENCSMDSPNLDMAMRFKTGMSRGGFIENVYIRNCRVKKSKVGIHMTMKYAGTLKGNSTPVVKNIDIRDCTFLKLLAQPIIIDGFSDSVRISDVTIVNCDFQESVGASRIVNASRIYLSEDHGAGLEE